MTVLFSGGERGLAMADVSVTGLAGPGRLLRALSIRSDAGAWALSAALMLVALIAPALWNGFPLIFPDTGGYLERPIDGSLELGRSAAYGLFLYAGARLAFWPNAIAQAVLTIWLIVLALRAHGLGGRPWLACAVVVALTAGTSLPWFTSQMMPDILFPAAVLALHLLIFRAPRLARWERYALGGVIAFAIVSHMAAAALCSALVGALWLLTRLARGVLPPARLTLAAGAVAAGIALCPISNWAITGTFAFTPGGSSFLFGRMLESGLVTPYLAERCPRVALRLCAYKDVLKDNEDSDYWLWDPNSPFRKITPHERDAEERAVIFGTLARYPWRQLTAALEETYDQLLSFQTEVSLTDNGPTIVSFTELAPQLLPQLMAARQQTGAIDVPLLNRVHVPVAVLAMAIVLCGLLLGRMLAPAALSALAVTVVLALLFNATICAVFSHSVDRYQSRLMPLVALAALLLALRAMRRVRRVRRVRLGPPSDFP